MKKFASLLAVVLLAGCANTYNPVPENYAGPTANISDSFSKISTSKVEFFYIEAVDGHSINNSRTSSISANKGRGMRMSPVLVQRAVPASKPMNVALVARTEYAAPILALTNSVFQVKGSVDFTPEAGKRYIVRGELKSDHSSVWIEDEDSHQVVSDKVEVQGSSKLGFFDK